MDLEKRIKELEDFIEQKGLTKKLFDADERRKYINKEYFYLSSVGTVMKMPVNSVYVDSYTNKIKLHFQFKDIAHDELLEDIDGGRYGRIFTTELKALDHYIKYCDSTLAKCEKEMNVTNSRRDNAALRFNSLSRREEK